MEGVHDSNILTEPLETVACPKCGEMLDVNGLPPFSAVQCPACETEFQIPAGFGSFLLLQLLGAGGMGGVYRARDEGLNREVAIKVMLKSLGDDPQFVETFQREAQAAARLNHRHIAQIYSFGQEKGQPYIAMELVPGGSLDKMMAEQGPLDPAAVIHIGAQIAEGLSVAAEAGMVHGDVKPENILFDADKNAKLVDFGLSAMQVGPGSDVWGTPYYIAPEKVRRQKCDYRSDIYSLGGTLFHAIAGVPPFEGADATAVVKARFDGPPKPIREIRPNIPGDVEALIARMLAAEPQMRYPTYGSLLGDMKRFLAKAGPVRLDKGGKKIVIKGKRGGAAGVAGAGAADELPPGMVPVENSEEAAEETEETARKRGCKMMAMFGVGLLLLAGLIAGGVFGFMAYSKKKNLAAEQAQITASQDKTRESIAKSVASAKRFVEKIHGLVPEAMGYCKAAADEAAKVLGEEARAALVPPEPDYAALKAPEATPAGTNAADTATSDEVSTMLDELGKKLPPELADMLKDLGKLPADQVAAKLEEAIKVLPPEQGDALKPNIDALKTMPAAAEGLAEALDDSGGGDFPPVVVAVRGMYKEAYAVKAAVALADQLLREIEQQAKTAEGFSSVTKQDAEALAKLNNTLVENVGSLNNNRQVAEVPRKVSQLKRALESVKTDVTTLAAQKRIEAAEAEKRTKAEAEAEKKRQEKEAYDSKVAEEKASVAEAEAANADMVKRFQFLEARKALNEVKTRLETPEAQGVALVALDRVNRIKDFHEFLIKKAPGYKSGVGWSIDAADAKTLSVGGKKIPWTDIFENTQKQQAVVVELVRGLITSDQAAKTLGLREKTRMMTNAALCFKLFYSDTPKAMEYAKNLANEAAQQFDHDADDIKQLIPEFFE